MRDIGAWREISIDALAAQNEAMRAVATTEQTSAVRQCAKEANARAASPDFGQTWWNHTAFLLQEAGIASLPVSMLQRLLKDRP